MGKKLAPSASGAWSRAQVRPPAFLLPLPPVQALRSAVACPAWEMQALHTARAGNRGASRLEVQGKHSWLQNYQLHKSTPNPDANIRGDWTASSGQRPPPQQGRGSGQPAGHPQSWLTELAGNAKPTPHSPGKVHMCVEMEQ